jgi:hypothetical protein
MRLRRKRKKKRLRLIKKGQEFLSPETFHPVCATIVNNPGISYVIAQISRVRTSTLEQLSVLTARTRIVKESRTSLTLWVTPLSKNYFPFLL